MKLTNEHIEEQILLMLDGELSETDTAVLLTWIGQHPEHSTLLDAYRSAYLEADQDMVFPDKESLLQPEAPVAVPFRKKRLVWMRAAAALVAGVCITVAGYLLYKEQPADRGSMVASHPKAIQIPVMSAHDTVKAVAVQTPVTAHHPAQQVQPARMQHKTATQGQAPVATQPGPVQQDRIVVEALAMMEESSFAVEQPGPANGISWEPSGNIAAVQAPEASPSSWGPVKGESLEGINELISRVQIIRNNIAGKAKSLKHATFVLRLGDKEIAIGK